MKSILSNDGIFQVAKNVTQGGLYHFKSYNNDNNSSEPKTRPHLLIDDAYGYSHKYKFLAVTSSYNDGTSIPIVSNNNSRLSFVSLSSMIEMGRSYIDECVNDYGTIYFSKEFAEMCKYIYLYKQLNVPIEEKYVIYLSKYLDEYNRMVDEDKFIYNGEIPKIEITDIINFETIRYCKIVKESENIIDNSIIHTRIDSSSIIKEEEIINDDESKYDKDIIFIRNCIDPDHENDKILDAFAKFKEGEYDYKSLALHSGVDYNKAYYYTRFINNYPAIERSIKYRNKMNNNDENINIENYENINNVDSEIVSNTLNGCNYKIKNNNRKRKKRRRKR